MNQMTVCTHFRCRLFFFLLLLHAQHIITYARVRRGLLPVPPVFISSSCHTHTRWFVTHHARILPHARLHPPPTTPPQRKPPNRSPPPPPPPRRTPSDPISALNYTHTRTPFPRHATRYEEGAAAAGVVAAGSIMSQMELAILKEDSLVQSRQNSRTSSPPGSDTTVGCGCCSRARVGWVRRHARRGRGRMERLVGEREHYYSQPRMRCWFPSSSYFQRMPVMLAYRLSACSTRGACRARP